MNTGPLIAEIGGLVGDPARATMLTALLNGRELARLRLVRRSARCKGNDPGSPLMGLVAFLVPMSAEFGLGAVFGRSLMDQLATYRSLSGAVGLAAQVIFAMFPVIQVWRL